MANRKVIMVLPHVNSCGGDLSQNWYVEWAYRIPGVAKLHRERKYGWHIYTDAASRMKAIGLFIRKKTAELKTGKHLRDGRKVVYEDMLEYDNVAKLYGRQKETVITIRTYMSDYLSFKSLGVNPKSMQSYKSKMRQFCAFLETKKYMELDVAEIDTAIIIQFIESISAEFSRASVKKYNQQLFNFFEYLRKVKKVIVANPVCDIPRMGRVVDQAPEPFHEDDRRRLKDVIMKNDIWLWLACEIQFYCAIRPGTEISS
ncbi:hypothetical protein [Viscerimonas tarda]